MYNLRKQRLAFLYTLIFLPGNCAAQSAGTPKKSPILGEVEGQPITEGDFAPQVQEHLKSLHEQDYRIKKQGLDNLINQKFSGSVNRSDFSRRQKERLHVHLHGWRHRVRSARSNVRR
jgi:hypothetical protein